VTRRVWFRAAALALVAVGVVAGLTAYFSSESPPPCGANGIPKWRTPTDGQAHRFAVVFPDNAACFFSIDDKQQLVAQLRLPAGARTISTAVPNGDEIAIRSANGPYTIDLGTGKVQQGGLAPFDNGTLTVADPERNALYVTQRGLLGFRVIDLSTGETTQVVHFKGFTWNPRFGPNPPTHGLVLRPDRPELWLLDSPNHALHVFDVSAAPRRLDDVRLERTLTTPGSLTGTADGRYLYVGDAGDVIDTQKQESIANLPALQDARAVLEVDWVDGHAFFPGFPR
jgi:DNA-binding beta-propeller fold protein YncE